MYSWGASYYILILQKLPMNHVKIWDTTPVLDSFVFRKIKLKSKLKKWTAQILYFAKGE